MRTWPGMYRSPVSGSGCACSAMERDQQTVPCGREGLPFINGVAVVKRTVPPWACQ